VSDEGGEGPPPLYERLLCVSPEDCAGSGRLRPPALLGLLQEAAGRDAAERGAGMDLLMDQGLAWMLVRLAAEVARWPRAGEAWRLSTWATSFGGAVAGREFALRPADAGTAGPTAGVEATSRWAVVDLAARRAVRLPAFVRALPTGDARGAARPAPAVEDPVEAPLLAEAMQEVGEGDLDRLGHANNTRYLDWALRALPKGFDDALEIAGFDIAFRKEVRQGDCLRIRTRRLDEERLAHDIRSEALEGREDPSARVVTRWRRRA